MYAQPQDFLSAAKSAAQLTPDLFGGHERIRMARQPSHLVVDDARLESGHIGFAERAYALLVQSITHPEQAERYCARTGSRLTPGRLIGTLDQRKRQALAALLVSAA